MSDPRLEPDEFDDDELDDFDDELDDERDDDESEFSVSSVVGGALRHDLVDDESVDDDDRD